MVTPVAFALAAGTIAAFACPTSQCFVSARLLKLIEDLRREDLRPYHEQPIGSPARAQWSKQHRKLLRACAAGGVADAEAHLATLERT
jgi:DNA-binding FadR family transcriptional regulator